MAFGTKRHAREWSDGGEVLPPWPYRASDRLEHVETSTLAEVDPFDLPEWLGTSDVTWESRSGLRAGHHVRGVLVGPGADERLECDLLAVDEAYPAPVVDDASRSRAHHAWRHGQVLIAHCGEALSLCVPGTRFDADLVLDALGRLAKAVGASEDHYALRLRVGMQPVRRTHG